MTHTKIDTLTKANTTSLIRTRTRTRTRATPTASASANANPNSHPHTTAIANTTPATTDNNADDYSHNTRTNNSKHRSSARNTKQTTNTINNYHTTSNGDMKGRSRSTSSASCPSSRKSSWLGPCDGFRDRQRRYARRESLPCQELDVDPFACAK